LSLALSPVCSSLTPSDTAVRLDSLGAGVAGALDGVAEGAGFVAVDAVKNSQKMKITEGAEATYMCF